MRKLVLTLMAIIVFASASFADFTRTTKVPVTLTVTIINPGGHGPQHPRTPAPEVYQDGYNMYVPESLIGDTMQLVQDDVVVFSMVITDEEFALPSTLAGTFTLQIFHDIYCYEGEIEL